MRSGTANLNFSSGDRLETEFHYIVRQRYPKGAITFNDPSSQNHRLKTALQQVSRYLIEFLTGQSSLSIRVQQQSTGDLNWIVYDPATRTRSTFLSESEMRTWLENRHREATL